MLAAGSGIPLMFLGEAEHTARGTAAEMSAPTIRHFRRRQLHFGALIVDLAVEALHRRGLASVSTADVSAAFPELETEDLHVIHKTEQADTDRRVTIREPRGIIEGIGLDLDNKSKTAKLRSRVSGTFEPQTLKK